MKRVILCLAGAFFIGLTISAYSQKTTRKDIYGRDITNTDGNRVNYTQPDKNVLKPVAATNMPLMTSRVATQTAITKIPFKATVDNMYSVMGTSIGRNSMHSVDIDNDGNVELVCTASTGTFSTGNYWYVMRYDPADKTWSQVWTSATSTVGINTLEVVDLNNDTKPEILIGYANGKLEIYNGETKELIKSATPITEGINSINYADADNDSAKEIVI